MNKPTKPPTPSTAGAPPSPCKQPNMNPSNAADFGSDLQIAKSSGTRRVGNLKGGAAAVATPVPNVPPTVTTASVELLKLIGHHESCARLQRARSISSCDCRRGSMDDPSIAIGLVMHFARISLAQRVAIPTVILELLARHVERGDPACRMVVEWLDTSGLIDLKPSPRSKRRTG